MKSIRDWQRDIHQLAVQKGWYDGAPRSAVEMHMLMTCELAEATEEVRKGRPAIYTVDGKPEGELAEMADVVIRILDYCESKGWNLESVMDMKHEFNKSRPHRHGGKRL